MQSKIFLHKYRVSAHEIGEVGAPGDRPLVYDGEEIDSGKKMRVEVFPVAALGIAVREKLVAEATAAKKLSHTNIPALLDFGVEDDDFVYVTEDFDGTTAEQWVTTCGPMPVSPVLRIASQVVSALGTAAFHGIVHRAINPGNLVLVPGQTAQGEWPLVKVLRFVGVAPAHSGAAVSAAELDRSLPYVSPEQLQHGNADFRSAMYSLGGTMWFLLTGAPPPLQANGATNVPSATTALAAKKMSAMPKEIQHLVAQMLSPSPGARPRDPLTFHKRLQECLTQLERPELVLRKLASSVPEPDAIGLKNQLVPLKVLAIVALFLAMAILAAVALRGHGWPRWAVRPKEPKGLPKRVARVVPSATPVSAKRAEPIVWIATSPSPALAESRSTQSLPAENSGKVQPPGTASVEYAPAEKLAGVPSPRIWEPPATLQTRKSAPATLPDASPPSRAPDPWKLAATTQVELAPSPTNLHDGKTSQASRQATSKKDAGPEVRRAESLEPEVKRTQPPRLTERSTAVVPDTTAPLVQLTNSTAETAETKPRKEKQTDPEPTILLKVPR